MDGSNVAKTIAELRVEIKNAIDPLEELRKKFVSVDDAIKKTQTNLSQFSQSFSNVGTSAKGMASQVGGAIQDIEKVSAATINKLAQIERTLVSTMAKARSMGVEVPGAKQELDVVRQLQDQLRIGEQISKETSKQIQNASNYATLQSRRVATLEKEVTLNKEAAAQEQLKNQSQQRSALAASQAAQQQRTSQEKVAQTIMQENALHQQTVFALEAKAASTLKQLTFNKMADGSIGQQLVALRGQLQQYQSLLTSGQVLSKVEVERLQQLQMQLEILQSQAKTKMADTGVESFSDAIKKNSVLASQWERKISWFLSGTAFYGGIRAIQGVSRALSQLESDMTVIARTTDDATFNFNKMRDELIEVGKDFGRGWESVSQVATEWTKAGYNVADTLELTRTSLLALNVADMTVQQATSGLIAIMSQWDLQAQDLELVIDKLNITSDRYAITTGDLVEAVLRSSGAARAANIEFDELVGMITATRVASGRAGAEIGNAMNTILSYITRQSTLNKLAQAGIATFADEARTKLRPAVDIMGDIVEKWQDNAEAMPEALIEMADSMGMFSEEMAEMVDLQGEWTDLQKIEVEQATAGVRRRQFLIALMRNFSQVQDVVNNLSEAEGYSMVQNVQTMKTLERQYEQLKLEMLGLTQALGDAGLMGQLKAVVSVGKDVVGFFGNLDSRVQTFILTLGELSLAMGILKSFINMMGGSAVLAKAGSLLGPWGTIAGALAGAGIAAYGLHTRQLRQEHEQYIEVVTAVADRQEKLNKVLEKSVKGSTAYNIAMDEKRELARAIADQYPELIAGYDTENELILLNTEMIRKANEEKQNSIDLDKEETKIKDEKIQKLNEEAEALQAKREHAESEEGKYQYLAKTIKDLSRTREGLIKAIEREGETAEDTARRKRELESVDELIIRLSKDQAEVTLDMSNITIDAINAVIDAYNDEAESARQARIDAVNEEIEKTKEIIEQIKIRLQAKRAEYQFEKTVKFRELERVSQSMIDAGAIHPIGPYTYGNYEKWMNRVMGEAEEGFRKLRGEISAADADLRFLNKTLGSLDRQLAELHKKAPEGGEYLGGDKAGNAAQKLTDITNKYIETAMRAADVQAMLNNETQRTIDGYKAKIDYHSRDTATAQERAIALQTEAEMMGKLKEKQEGVHKEANYLREALAKLEQRQSTLNITTDEGWDTYKKLETQIENIKDSIEKLGIEWFNLAKAQEVGISGLEKVRSLRATEIDQLETQIKHLIRANATANEIAEADRLRTRVLELYNEKIAENINKISEQEKHLTTAKELLDAGKISQEQYNRELAESNKLTAEYSKELTGFKQKMEDVGSVTYAAARALSNFDYFAKQGVYSIERQLSEVQSIYSQFENLTIEHQRDYYNRQAGYYKQMLLDMKRDAEDAYHDRIKLLERETEGAIALIQRQIDALDEEAKQEDREEERRKHEERLKELYEKRRYHELRTGREHSEAILDIDKQIGEEQRRWEQRQAEWTREDKKDELRKEIEDVRDAAEKQREKWQEVYEAMQRDFSDHNLSLIALASAYDPAFFDDAKNKAEQWVQGFKQGTAGFGDYLSSLTPSAGRVVDSIRDEWERPYYEEPEPEPEPPAKPEPEFPPSYTIEQWGHVYTVKDGGHVILKNGRYIPAEDFKYLPSEILQLARDMKMGKAHTGAMTASAGIAELIPGEMIFPPNLSIQLERLISTLSARPLPAQAQQQWRGGGVEIRGNLLNVEKASFEDETDMEILARELNRQLTSLRN